MAKDFYNSNAIYEFEDEIHDVLMARLEEIRDDLLSDYGFYFNYEDAYLMHPDEMIINIY